MYAISLRSNIAVRLCDQGELLVQFTYDEILKMYENINLFLSKYITSNTCIGIVIEDSVYIPSLILSCKALNIAFIFLNETDEHVADTISTLEICWIVTFSQDFEQLDFMLQDKVNLGNDNDLNLYRKTNISSFGIRHYENIFYVMKSSGSTGTSKLVAVEHFCIDSNIDSLRAEFHIQPSDIIYFGTQLTFDPSMVELLIALYSGACLLMVPKKCKINPTKLYYTLFPISSSDYEGISVLQIVPSVFNRWSKEQKESILLSKCLRILAFGGEKFPQEVLDMPTSSSLKVFNLYGITEVSCWATIHEVDKKSPEIYLGKELSDTIIEVRNDINEKITSGMGEIFIGSNRRICHVVNEILPKSLPVFRATGDLVRITKDGLVYIGRKNNVVKRFGHKINLQNIEEKVFKETKLICKAVWHEEQNKLLCFILLNETNSERKFKILDKLRIKLLHSLPKECFPDFFDILIKLPVTSHGKIDCHTLKTFYERSLQKRPENKSDWFVCLCCKYLGVNEKFIESNKGLNFFDLGGNSILALQLLNELREANTPSELVTAIFEKNIEYCVNLIQDQIISYESCSHTNSPQYQSLAKKMKHELSLKVLWKHSMGACVDASPIAFDYGNETYVAVGSFSNIFTIVEAKTGKEISKFVLSDVIEASALSSECGRFLYIGCMKGDLYCLNYIQKNINWVYHAGDHIKSRPCYCNEDKTAIVFGSYDQHIHCLNVLDGAIIWKSYIGDSISSNPLYDENLNRLYITSTIGQVLCLCSKSGKILWHSKRSNPIFTSPSFSDPSHSKILFAEVRGDLFCISHNGDVVWKFQARGQIFSSPIVFNEFIMFGCHDGCLYILKNNLHSAELLHRVALNVPIRSTPFAFMFKHKKLVAVASTGGLVCLADLENGNILSLLQLEDIFSSPFVKDDKLYIGARDDHIYCIEIG